MSKLESSPAIVIEPRRGLFDIDLTSVWEHRVLLFFLLWRDLKVRYKQSAIGIGWAIVQPLVSMLIFTVIFGRFAKIPSDGLPYPIFAYCALLPWNYFSGALSRCVASVVGDAPLIRKVYFPRLILPIVGTLSGLVDFCVAFTILLGMMAWYGISPGLGIITLPFFLLFAQLTALSVGLWLAPLNARFRDIGHAMGFVIQIWMFASPVVYPVSMIPEKYRLFYSLNPMAGVIEGFRWALLDKAAPDFGVIAISAAVVIVLLASGIVFFRKMESTFADVV